LELITAKIRKLHEKSIVYNHLHYIEEEQLQNSKRIKFDQMVMRQAAENNMPNEIVVESQQNEMFATQLKFEEKMASIEKSVEEETLAATAEEHPESIEQKQDIEIEKNTIETPTPSTSFNQVKLAGKIGINDRFRFIKNLFGGNGIAMEEAIKEIEQCGSASSLAACIDKLRSTNQWDDEDENVIDFIAMLK
jgi:hypothetical protein